MNNKVDAKKSGPTYVCNVIRLADGSFEAPNSFVTYADKWQPEAAVEMSMRHAHLSGGEYEVFIKLTLTVKIEDSKVFIAEAEQSGLFTMEGFNENELEYLLEVKSPELVFPYARQTITDLVVRGGFPPLYLNPVDFEGQYRQKKQKETEKEDVKAG